jgi:hypothetical protein
MLHQKMPNFQRRLFYALVCSEDNVVLENFKDGVTNNHSNTNIKIVNLGGSGAWVWVPRRSAARPTWVCCQCKCKSYIGLS